MFSLNIEMFFAIYFKKCMTILNWRRVQESNLYKAEARGFEP